MDNPGFQKEPFTTKDGLKGTLSKTEIDGKIVIYLVLDEGFHGASLRVSNKYFNDNKERIMEVLKSIKIRNE